MQIAWMSVYDLSGMTAPAPQGHWVRVLAADMRDRRIAPLAALAPLPGDEIDRNRKATGDRSFFAARRAVLRSLIGTIASCRGEDVQIAYDRDGAPRVLQPEGFFVSIAGQGPFALLAIADTPVGVDFEPLTRNVAPVSDVLHADERERLAALAGEEAGAEFLFVWTAKEACLKARGQGFLEDPALFAVAFEEEAIAVWRDGQKLPVCGLRHIVALGGEIFAAACVAIEEPGA